MKKLKNIKFSSDYPRFFFIIILILAVNINTNSIINLLLLFAFEIAYLIWVIYNMYKTNKNPDFNKYGRGLFLTINSYAITIVFVAMALMGAFFKPLAEKPGMIYYVNLFVLYIVLLSTTIIRYRLITNLKGFTYQGEVLDRDDISEIGISVDNPKDIHLSFVFKSNRRTIDLNKFSSEETLEILNYFGKLREEIKNS